MIKSDHTIVMQKLLPYITENCCKSENWKFPNKVDKASILSLYRLPHFLHHLCHSPGILTFQTLLLPHHHYLPELDIIKSREKSKIWRIMHFFLKNRMTIYLFLVVGCHKLLIFWFPFCCFCFIWSFLLPIATHRRLGNDLRLTFKKLRIKPQIENGTY